MKALPFIVLALCAAFLLLRQRTVTDLVEKNTVLETRIGRVEAGLDAGRATDLGAQGRAAKTTRGGGARSGTVSDDPTSLEDIDLAEFAAAIERAGSQGMPNLQVGLRIRALLLDATPEEVEVLVRRTEELDAPKHVRARLLRDFLQALSESHPGEALKLGFDSPVLDADDDPWVFSRNFQNWMRKEPAMAMVWFDAQIADGALESKRLDPNSSVRLQFEATALSTYLVSDPELVRTRLMQMPENLRERVFNQGHLLRFSEKGDATYAALIRETLPEKRHLDTFNPIVYHFVQDGGYERVGTFLSNIAPSESERAAIVENAAGHKIRLLGWRGKDPNEEDLASLRKFAREQAPETADLITGRAVAMFAETRTNQDRAVQIVRDLHAAGPNDELLVGFLQKAQGGESARELAGLIENTELRTEILNKLEGQDR